MAEGHRLESLSAGLTGGLGTLLRSMNSYYSNRIEGQQTRPADIERALAKQYDADRAQAKKQRLAVALLEVCIDEARFMRGLLGLEQFKSCLADLLLWLGAHPWKFGSEKSVVKLDALEALHYVALASAVERARFIAMTGLPDRTARRVLASLLDFGVLSSPTSRAPVTFAVPLRSLRFLFPRLWPEAEADVEAPARLEK